MFNVEDEFVITPDRSPGFFNLVTVKIGILIYVRLFYFYSKGQHFNLIKTNGCYDL